MLSAKWTAVSFFALSALGVGSFAFAGCTVTSGTVNDDGGTGNPPPTDGGATDSATDAPVTTNTCATNTKQKGSFVSDKCQNALNGACCAELTACFNIVVVADGGPASDCNTFTDCIDACRTQPDVAKCESECALDAPKNVQDAYDAITACATKDTAANAACQ